MATEAQIDRLVRLVYAGALHPVEWPAFLNEFADAVGGMVPALIIRTGDHARLIPTMDEDVLVSHEYYSNRFPWNDEFLALPCGQVGVIGRQIAESDYRGSEFCNEWALGLGLGVGMTAKVAEDDQSYCFLGVYREPTLPMFNVDQVALLARLVPHVQQAFRVQQRLGLLERDLQAASAALDGLPTGVIFLDGRGRVTRTNRLADAILVEDDGLTSLRGRLCVVRRRDQKLLEQAIADALNPGMRPGGHGAALRLPRPSGAPMLDVVVSPVQRVRAEVIADADAVAIVLVGDGRHAVDVPSGLLQALYNLTPAEANVVAALAGGDSPDAIAELLGVQPNTVRAHLKAAYVKTGTRGQAELVALVLRSPASAVPIS